MIRNSNKIIFILGIIIITFFNFWNINEFPQDVNAEIIIFPNALRCLQWGHNTHTNPQDCLQQLYNRWETRSITSRNYDLAAFAVKLWLFILSIAFNIFGYSVFSMTLASAIVSITAIFLTYKLGKLLYSQEVGILAGVFLSTSLVYNIIVRSGCGFTIITATSLAVFYYIYKYLQSGLRHYLIISGILLGIGSLDAPPQFFFILAGIIAILFFNFSSGKQSKIKELIVNLKDIALLFLWAIATSFIFTTIYAWYYNTSVFSVYKEIYFWINQRFHGARYTHQYVSRGVIESLKYAIAFIKNIFIGMSPFDLDDYAHLLERLPMITPIISVFFIGGLFFSTVKSKANRILLIWLGINFIVYMFFIRVQSRYVIAFLPAVCIVSAYGIVKVVSKIKIARYSNIIKQSIYVITILTVSYVGYKNFFVLYKNNDANLRRFHNNSKIAEFIVRNSKPEDCLVVLGENLFSCRDAVVFNMQYKPYKVLYLEEILYNKAGGSDKRQITIEAAKETIQELESDALKNNKIIYYVFSEHSIDYYFPAMVPEGLYAYVKMFKDIFLTLHPYSKPIEILRYSNGDPTHSIFMVNK